MVSRDDKLDDGAAVPPRRGPNEWPEAQRSFMQAVLAGSAVPSTDVWIRWWTKAPGRSSPVIPGSAGSGILRAITGLVTLGRWAKGGPQGTWVAVWQAPSRSGSPPDLIVQVEPDDLPTPTGHASAALLGEVAPNGALCLVVGGQRAAPIFNPLTPAGLLLKVAGTRP